MEKTPEKTLKISPKTHEKIRIKAFKKKMKMKDYIAHVVDKDK